MRVAPAFLTTAALLVLLVAPPAADAGRPGAQPARATATATSARRAAQTGHSKLHPAKGPRDNNRIGDALRNVGHVARVLRPRNTQTLARVDRFKDLRVEYLDARRHDLGKPPVAGLLLDVDETLAPHLGRISRENKKKIAALLDQGLAVGVYSNAAGDATPGRKADLDELRTMGVYVAGDEVESKPAARGFETAVRGLAAHAARRGPGKVRITATNTVMVDDSYMTGGGAIRVGRQRGARLAGMDLVKVRPVATDERLFRTSPLAWASRTFQRVLRSYGDVAAAIGQLLAPRLPRPLQLSAPVYQRIP
jgi:predicted HAD superfamily phosphohydrolase YqeG